ncbi:MAG: hypothetical protein ACYS8Z_19745 [Planctomycetota bacterium]|jgi:hypothetical protein
MNSDEIMNAWKERNSRIETSGDLTDKVMHHVQRYERLRKRPVLNVYRLIEAVSSSPAAAAAAVALGAVVGIVRISMVVLSFLAV